MTEGRKLYDIIMLWVNFGILVALFIKFARKPLMDAVHVVRCKLEGEIGEITKQHGDSKAGLDSEEAKLRIPIAPEFIFLIIKNTFNFPFYFVVFHSFLF